MTKKQLVKSLNDELQLAKRFPQHSRFFDSDGKEFVVTTPVEWYKYFISLLEQLDDPS